MDAVCQTEGNSRGNKEKVSGLIRGQSDYQQRMAVPGRDAGKLGLVLSVATT
jgi:hypothetical protein